MDDVGRWLLLLLFVVLSFCFYAAETALVSMNETKVRIFAEQNPVYQKTCDRLFAKPLKKKVIWLNLTYLICLCAAVYHGYILIGVSLKEWSSPLLKSFDLSQDIAGIGVQLISFALSLFVVLCLCNMLPRRIFSNNPEKAALKLYPWICGISMPFRPLVALIVIISNGIGSLLGFGSRGFEEEVTEEEIRSLVDEGEEKGVIEREEREMINNIFDFDDCTAADLMTHRTDVVAVDIHSKISDIVYYAINRGFSRIPVYEDDIDNIKGVIYVKDLLCLVGCQSSDDFNIIDFIRKTLYVPEAKKCIDLFKLFQLSKVHMAVVVDDYGGTAGIITMEDLLEAIVGNIQDEYDNEQEEIVPLDENSYLLDGAVELSRVGELFNQNWDQEEEDYDTLGGLITELLGRIPEENEAPSVIYKGILFSVMLVEDHRIIKVKAQLSEQKNSSEEEQQLDTIPSDRQELH